MAELSGLAFDRVAELYDRVRPGYPERLLEFVVPGGSIRDVLEVGCGPGQLTQALVARGLRVEAVEPGPALAVLARRRAAGALVHVGRFEDVEFGAECFDALVSATAFHWVDPTVGWAKAARVVRRGGRLALLSRVFVSDEQALPAHQALREIYGAPWRLRRPEVVIAGALERRANVAALWAWLENPAIESEDGRLFGEACFDAVPEVADLSGRELLDVQRTTATHLALDADSRRRVERRILALVERLGGRYPLRQLAVAAVARRR